MRLFLDLELEPEEFHIYIYAKSYFYKKVAAGRLQYLSVKRGQYMKAHLSMQVKYHTKTSQNFPKNTILYLENKNGDLDCYQSFLYFEPQQI